ncbi:hypothetical protein glysoja_002036 [Glycine soja]|nr:hypothetical protein glysoja_002036 [Glycine soja]
MVAMGNLQQKAKELFKFKCLTPKEMFYLITFTLLSLLLPLSFLLLAKFSDAQYYLQTLAWYHSPQHFPYVLTLALHINPLILYVLVSIISMASLIHGLTGKIIILSDSLSSSSTFLQPRILTAWIVLCTFQVCVGLGIEGSIEAGLYDSNDESMSFKFGVERILLSRVVFLLGLHETMQVWARMVVRPVVDDTVFGGARKRVVVAASLGALWWWRLREDVESLVVMVEAKTEQLMDVRVSDFVGWWLYYLTLTIGIVRVLRGLMWMVTVCLCRRRRRRATGVSTVVEHCQIDDKV